MLNHYRSFIYLVVLLLCCLLPYSQVISSPENIKTSDSDKNNKLQVDQEKSETNSLTDSVDDYHFTKKINVASQIDCPESEIHCTTLQFNEKKTFNQVYELIEKNTGKILIEFPANKYKVNSEQLEDMLLYVREIAKRDGQISIEPLKILTRGGGQSALSLPLIGDILQVGYNLFTRTWNHFKYNKTKNYNAKIVYLSSNKTVLYMYFVHRNYGDLCESLYSQCDIIEYLDDEIFDKTLSKRLLYAQKNKSPVKIIFNSTQVQLPQFKLDLERLKKINESLRLYKWLIASKGNKKQKAGKERFLSLEVAVAAIKYSIQVYDAIKAIQMYAPAREMKTQIIYETSGKKEKIKAVIFTPSLL